MAWSSRQENAQVQKERQMFSTSKRAEAGECAHLVAEEAARDVDLLAPDDDNLLAAQDLLGDNARQPSEKMALAINHDGGRGEGGHRESVGSGRSRRKRRVNESTLEDGKLDAPGYYISVFCIRRFQDCIPGQQGRISP